MWGLSRKLFATEEASGQQSPPPNLILEAKFVMGLHAMTAVFLLSYLCIPEEAMGGMSNSKSRLREVERRHQIGRLPLSNDLLISGKGGLLAKRRQEQQFDDYGHMRFGKRGEGFEDYGHMRFGKRD